MTTTPRALSPNSSGSVTDNSTNTSNSTLPKVFLLKNRTVPRDDYHDRFSRASYDPIFLPLLQHEYVDHSELKVYMESTDFLTGTSAVIITSQRAIEAVNSHLHELNAEAREIVLSKPVYTVGPATAKALTEAGYRDIRGGQMAGNGKILAEIILKELEEEEEKEEEKVKNSGVVEVEEEVMLQTPTTKPALVFFTGKTRRDIIPKRLIQAGVRLQERVVYQTFALDDIDVRVKQHLVKTLSSENLANSLNEPSGSPIPPRPSPPPPSPYKHYLVFFSPAEADGVVETLLGMKDRNCYLAAIGPTTEDYLIKNGLTPDVVAEKPDALHLRIGIMNHRASIGLS